MHFYTAFLMRCPDIFYIFSPLSVIVISNNISSGFLLQTNLLIISSKKSIMVYWQS